MRRSKSKRKSRSKSRSKRVILRNHVHFGPHSPPAHSSFLSDLSDKGAAIMTNWAYEPGTKLYMAIEAAGDIYGAEGVVVWTKRITPGFVQLVKTGMGVRFTDVDEELVNFYEEKIKEEIAQRGSSETH
jgi:Tfp pilus assembly protein PilZ